MRFCMLLCLCAMVLSPAVLHAQNALADACSQDPACQLLTPVSAGGPLPKSRETVVIRWLGHTNYELVYRDNVFLLDAYYDRVPRKPPHRRDVSEFKKATAIFIGHPHFDHMSDAASVARQTGATVVGAAQAGDVVAKGGLARPAIQGRQRRRSVAVSRRPSRNRARATQRHCHNGAGGIPGETAGGVADGGAAGACTRTRRQSRPRRFAPVAAGIRASGRRA